MNESLQLVWIEGRFAVCRLDAALPLPDWARALMTNSQPMGFCCVTRLGEELSIVAEERFVVTAGDVRIERGFAAMRVAGTLAFSMVGVLAELCGKLAEAGVPVFVVSTYDTDVLLVKEADRAAAERVLGVR